MLDPNTDTESMYKEKYNFEGIQGCSVVNNIGHIEPVKPRALLASQQLMLAAKEPDGSLKIPDQGHTARDSVKNWTIRYFAESRAVFRPVRFIHLPCDGVQAAGDHNEIFLCWDPKCKVACCAPIKVEW